MIKKKIKNNAGFVALLSAIIISAILLLMVTNLSLTGFYDRSNILDFELKEKSSALAEACADTAILKLANDPSYTPLAGGEDVFVGSDKCKIVSIVPLTFPRVIKVQAIYPAIGNPKYYTNFEIEVNSNISVIRWEETPN